MITESVAFILGAAIGGLLVWIWIQVRASYTSVRGSLAAREKAKQEKAKQAQKAREEITKGRRALLRTSAFGIHSHSPHEHYRGRSLLYVYRISATLPTPPKDPHIRLANTLRYW